MNDFKSKLPDLKELTSMTSKLFNGLKTTVNEIIHDYKEKRAEDEAKEQTAAAPAKEEAKAQTTEAAPAKETAVSEAKAENPTPAAEPEAAAIAEEKEEDKKA